MQLTGAGDYNLNSIKLEEVTESFLGLDQDVRGCQNEEHYDECTTRQYIDKFHIHQSQAQNEIHLTFT